VIFVSIALISDLSSLTSALVARCGNICPTYSELLGAPWGIELR
jgi:hypothetical protein